MFETDKESEHEKSIFNQKYNILMDLGGICLLIWDHDRFYIEFHSIQSCDLKRPPQTSLWLMVDAGWDRQQGDNAPL